MTKANKLKKLFYEIVQMAIGILLASIGLKAFLLPNGFLDGGVTGIAILLSEMFSINISISLVVISIPFLMLAWNNISKRIFVKSTISISLLAIIIHFQNFSSITEDKLLIAIFGGLFLGAGIGLNIKNGAVLDGSEILGIYINNKFGISIGKVIFMFNVILFSFTALFLSVEVAMYSILTFLVTAKVIDLMIEGFEDYIGLMIISDESEIIKQALISELGLGLTIYNGAGGYEKEGNNGQKEIIHTIINRIDIKRTYNLLEDLDEKAFIIEFDVNNIKGGVLKKYMNKAGLKKMIPGMS